MKKIIIWVALFGPLLLAAQEKGIKFTQNLAWQKILQKAKAENKYIFVDCYASWCGPCKWMDKNVYVNDSVGDFMNSAFISVKIQMDTTKHDSQDVQKWYETAHEIATQFRINAYPTFLFFSPDGQPVHKGIGAAKAQEFISLAKDAINPNMQYYTLLSDYQQGNKRHELLYSLAIQSRKFRNDSLASRLATEYMHGYLEKLSSIELWTKENISFISIFPKDVHINGKLFERYFKDKGYIDSVMGNSGYANKLINAKIYEQEVKPLVDAGIKDSLEPNWTSIEMNIEKKYGRDYVRKNVLQGCTSYFWARKEWQSYAKYFVQQVEDVHIEKWPAGEVNSLIINNYAFEVFKYSKDNTDLELALSWVDRAISMQATPTANEMDTKANLLYKLGRKQEGLALEEQSHKLAPEDTEIAEAYEKMKNGQSTWQ